MAEDSPLRPVRILDIEQRENGFYICVAWNGQADSTGSWQHSGWMDPLKVIQLLDRLQAEMPEKRDLIEELRMISEFTIEHHRPPLPNYRLTIPPKVILGSEQTVETRPQSSSCRHPVNHEILRSLSGLRGREMIRTYQKKPGVGKVYRSIDRVYLEHPLEMFLFVKKKCAQLYALKAEFEAKKRKIKQ